MKCIRNGFSALAVTASLLLGASIAVTPALAASGTFHFTGIVDLVSGNVTDVATDITPATLFHADITYSPSPLGDTHGTYPFTITGANVSYDTGYNVTLGGGAVNFILIQGVSGGDLFTFRAPLDAPLSTQTSAGYRPDYFEVRFNASHGFLNTGTPSLSDISNARGTLHFIIPGLDQPFVTGKMTPVPLPPAVILFGAGLVALIGLGARNWQRKAVGDLR